MNFKSNLTSTRTKTISVICISLIIVLTINILATPNFILQSFAKKEVTLTALLVEPRDRWDMLISMALQDLRTKHPDYDIRVNYTSLKYDDARTQMSNLMANQTSVDLLSIDQIWLGEFAEKGFLTDLTTR